MQIKVEKRGLFLSLGTILFPQSNDLTQRFGVETVGFRLGIDVADIVGESLPLLLQTLDALHQCSKLSARYSATIRHLSSFNSHRYGRPLCPDQETRSSVSGWALANTVDDGHRLRHRHTSDALTLQNRRRHKPGQPPSQRAMAETESISPYRRGQRSTTHRTAAPLFFVPLFGLVLAACSSGDGDESTEQAGVAAIAPVADGGPVPDGSTGLRVCNGTESSVGVAVGYDDGGEMVSEGWWNLSPLDTENECAFVITGALQSRYYYVYAIDYTLGGEWGGEGGDLFMCTRDLEFTIRGVEDCVARGYDRAGFVQIDTGDRTVHNVQLTVQQGIGGQ